MKKAFKKVVASVVAVSSIITGVSSISANAYWTTKTIYNGTVAVGTAYCSVSSTSIYATTSTSYSGVERSVSIIRINDVNQDPWITVSSRNSTAVVNIIGSSIYEAKTRHVVSGYGSLEIAMNA
jgi:hypothetical protein